MLNGDSRIISRRCDKNSLEVFFRWKSHCRFGALTWTPITIYHQPYLYSVRKMEPVVTKYFCDGSDRKTPSLLERPTMVFVGLVVWLSAPTADGFFGRLVEIEHQQVNIWSLIRFAIWKNPKFVWNGRRRGWFSGFRVCLKRSGWFSGF